MPFAIWNKGMLGGKSSFPFANPFCFATVSRHPFRLGGFHS